MFYTWICCAVLRYQIVIDRMKINSIVSSADTLTELLHFSFFPLSCSQFYSVRYLAKSQLCPTDNLHFKSSSSISSSQHC